MCARFTRSPLVLSLIALHGSPVLADEAAPATPVPAVVPVPSAIQSLEAVTVTAEADNDYKVDHASSPKYTAPLRDTPQSVQVVPKRVIEEQGQLTLREILSNVPGITFGAAEGGNGFGDNITLRGSRIDNDIQVDGIRDSAQTARVDPFNLEQLEVVKGASSVYSGAGAVSGTVNMVSKTAKADDFVRLGAGVGTDEYYRATVDANRALSDTAALRLNVMAHRNESPDRDEVSASRWGIAPSLALGLGTDLRLTVNYVHQENERIPDRGILWRRATGGVGEPVPVDKSTYFGWSNTDREEAVVDALTAVIEHDISRQTSVRNTTRLARTENLSSLATMNGLVCIDGVPFNATGTCPVAGGNTFSMTGVPGNIRDDLTDVVANITDVTWKFSTAGMAHTLVTGFALTEEDFERDGWQARTLANGALPTEVVRDLFDPDPTYDIAFRYFRGGNQVQAKVSNRALYAFDTLAFNPQWQLNAGLRYERNEASYKTTNITVATGAVASVTEADVGDDLVSSRIGVVYKPAEQGSIYAAVGNSLTPSATTVIASCTASGNNQNCGLDPEETTSYELGTKWDLLDSRLSLSGALFRNERNSYRINSADPTEPQRLDGENYVEGIELGASGKLTDQWAVYAGYAFMDSEVLQGAANGALIDSQKGYEVPNTPRHTGNVWTTYLLPRGIELGYGLRHTGSYKTEAAAVTATVPRNTVHNAMVGYRVSRHVFARLNINNLTDETYWTSVRSQGWGHPGEGRSAVLSVDVTL